MIRMWSNNSNSLLGRMQNGTAMLENNLMVSNITLLYNPATIFSDIKGAEDISTQNLHYIESSCKAGRSMGWEQGRVWSMGREHPLEKGMATQSTILAWRIPWTEESVSQSPTLLSNYYFY